MKRITPPFVILFCSFLAQLSFGQSPPAGATGIPPFSTTDGASQYETINVANFNILLDIPVRHKAGRIPFAFDLTANSSMYKLHPNAPPDNSWAWASTMSPRYVTDALRAGSTPDLSTASGLDHSAAGITCNGQPVATQYSNFSWEDLWGTVHPFNITVDTCVPSTKTATSTDGSGHTLSVTSHSYQSGGGFAYQLWNASGIQISPSTNTDPNGNQESYALTIVSNTLTYKFTDTLGQNVLTDVDSNTGSSYSRTFSYTDATGTQKSYTVTYQFLTQQTNFQCTNPAVGDIAARQYWLPTAITLPDSSTLGITYETTPGYPSSVTGRIATITLPTGATVTYAYTGANNGIDCATGIPPTMTRNTPDGIWTYAFTPPAAGSYTSTVTKTDPTGNKTVYTFWGSGTAPSSYYSPRYETQRVMYNATNNVQATVVTCYNGNTLPNCVTPTTISGVITQTDVYTYPGNMTTPSRSNKFYNSFGLLTDDKEYDYGPTLVRDTIISYGTYSSGSCLDIGNHIQDRPCLVTANDSAAPPHTQSQSRYVYDPNGNLLSVSSLVGGSTYLTKAYTYGPGGVLATATDVNGTITNYTDGGCNSSFPTTIAAGGLSTSLTWDCNGAVVTSSTDANNQQTSYSYVVNSAADPFWRVLSVVDPLQNVTNFTYTPANGSQPATIESALIFGSSISETLKTLDSTGRIHIVQHRQGPSATNYDSVETDYDANGRVSRVTLPYSGAKSATNSTVVSTTYTYDALDRPLTIKDPAGATVTLQYTGRDVLRTLGPASTGDGTFSRQMQYDGLGRLLSVCEITAGTSAFPGGACGQDSPQTGYLTAYAYDALGGLKGVTQNAQSSTTQTRSFTFDGLGRLNSELNPETGQNAPGSTAYTYDSDPSAACAGTFNGDLVKRVDNAGDVTCYAYDALHRVTGITYPSGPKAGSTKKKTFVYDTTTFSCPNGANVAGRLAKAYTGSTSVSTGYCYSPRGEITDVYQSTPHSGGYAHFSLSYWANGQLDVLSGFPSSLPSFTYGPDGEGRPKTVSASSGQNPVTATAYNPAQQVTSVTFGSGDNDGYSINSGRMTRYTHNVNGSAVAGTLSWNTNGTLKSLGITDPLNSADAETCTYHYDDLVRVSSVGCGTPWSQTFSYDPFGNVTKSGSSSWMPGYSSATNHYTLTGTSYDANGNLTNDTFNTYTWDAEGKMITLNGGTTNTFDAFGRIAETGASTGPWTQFVYLPGGTNVLATMSSATTLQKALIPLPSGGQAVYNGSTLAYYRHPDWLGTSRMATTPSRTVYFDGAYAPFGESYATIGTTDLMFAGHTQDVVEGGLYDTLNRKYQTAQGRWISPDPAGLSVVNFTDPQSWNRYAYVGNNPLFAVDPIGLGVGCPGGPSRNRSCDAHEPGDFRQANCIVDGVEGSCDRLASLMHHDEFDVLVAAYGPIRNDPDTGQLQQVAGWQLRKVLDLNSGDPYMKWTPIWVEYNPLPTLPFVTLTLPPGSDRQDRITAVHPLTQQQKDAICGVATALRYNGTGGSTIYTGDSSSSTAAGTNVYTDRGPSVVKDPTLNPGALNAAKTGQGAASGLALVTGKQNDYNLCRTHR